MEKNNLVARIPSEKDARINLIHLTTIGKSLFLKTRPLMFHCLNKVEDAISIEEKEMLLNIMTKIQNNLNNQSI
jgi:DNA-binding MarR family transcriptional regulator